METYYRRDNAGWQFRQAWLDAAELVQAAGVVGQRATATRELAGRRPNKALAQAITRFESEGFARPQQDEICTISVTQSFSAAAGLAGHRARVELERHLNEALGWAGLGWCDGGDIGNGEATVFCVAVDAELGVAAVERVLAHLHAAPAVIRVDEDAVVTQPAETSSDRIARLVRRGLQLQGPAGLPDQGVGLGSGTTGFVQWLPPVEGMVVAEAGPYDASAPTADSLERLGFSASVVATQPDVVMWGLEQTVAVSELPALVRDAAPAIGLDGVTAALYPDGYFDPLSDEYVFVPLP